MGFPRLARLWLPVGGQGGPPPVILPVRAVFSVVRRGRYAGRDVRLDLVRSKRFPGPVGFFSLRESRVRAAAPAYGSSDAPAVSMLSGGGAWEIPDRKPGRVRGYLVLGGWA